MPSAEVAPGRTTTSAGPAMAAGPTNTARSITSSSNGTAAREKGREVHLGERTMIPPFWREAVVRASGQSAPFHQAGQWPVGAVDLRHGQGAGCPDRRTALVQPAPAVNWPPSDNRDDR